MTKDVIKKIFAFVPGTVAVLYLIVPLLWLIAVASGRYLELYHPTFIAALLTVISVAALVASLIFKTEFSGINGAVCAFILPLTAVTQAYFVYHAIRTFDGYDTLVPAIVAAVGTVANIILYVQCADDTAFKAACGVITVLFSIAAVGYFIYLLVSVSVFSENERFRGDVSPDGKYEITVTTHDAGLLTDGETYVNVRRTAASGALFGQLKYKPQRIYKGGELEYEIIEIEWISNDVLSINGKPYTVDGKEVVLPEPEESSLAEETSAPVEESEQSDASADELSQSASGEETSAE